MNIHEYQAKAVLREFGVPVSRGVPVLKASDAADAAQELGGPLWVVKSQIHAGGRGKGKFKEPEAGEKGGVRLARSIEEVEAFASQMLGRTLVTAQTGPAGKTVNRLYLEDGSRYLRRSSICPFSSIARQAASLSSSRPKAAWTSKRSPATDRARSSPCRSIRSPARCRITAERSPRPWACPATSPSRPSSSPRGFTRPSSPRIWRCSRSTRWW